MNGEGVLSPVLAHSYVEGGAGLTWALPARRSAQRCFGIGSPPDGKTLVSPARGASERSRPRAPARQGRALRRFSRAAPGCTGAGEAERRTHDAARTAALHRILCSGPFCWLVCETTQRESRICRHNRRLGCAPRAADTRPIAKVRHIVKNKEGTCALPSPLCGRGWPSRQRGSGEGPSSPQHRLSPAPKSGVPDLGDKNVQIGNTRSGLGEGKALWAFMSPHPEEQPCGCVSKDRPERTGASSRRSLRDLLRGWLITVIERNQPSPPLWGRVGEGGVSAGLKPA